MEFLSRYWQQVRSHLGGLGVSQRIAIGLCAVLVLVGSAWLVQWSRQSQGVPLLAQSLSAEDQTRMLAQLQTLGIKYEQQGGQILVSPDDRQKALAQLQQSGALPAKTSISFANLMSDANPFLARDDARWRKERALEAELSGVIQHFSGVRDARVFIQTPQQRRIGGDGGKASASVYVHSEAPAGMDKRLVSSIADFVSGAVEGLSADAVKIVDAASGRSYRVPGADDAMPMDMLDLRRQREEHYTKKIQDQLAYIAGVLVGVHADVDVSRKRVMDTKLGTPTVSEESSLTNNTMRGGEGVGPGVKPNTARAVTGGAAGESSTKEETKTSYNGRRNETVTNTETAPGDIRKLAASINVPRSYFVGIFKHLNPQGGDPKDADLQPIIKTETTKIRSQVKPLIAATDDSQIEVDWFFDTALAGAGGPAGAPGVGVSMAGVSGAGPSAQWMDLARRYGPQAGLGLLAFFALFSVLRMGRKAQVALSKTAEAAESAAAAVKEAAQRPIETLPTEGGPVGEALSTDTVLEGREVDQDEVRVRHIIRQIGQMVKDDRDTAVSLVEQWVGESR